jgi:hypothetical protein
MAVPINTPSTGDIWHLSIDDLLAPLPEKTCLGGPGPFVINLSASTAPIGVPARTFDGCEEAHVYQVQRMEDRRPRYRLRLGPFAQEEEADAILQKVRDIYPGALTATADADDLRMIATLQAKAEPKHPPAQAVMQPTAPPVMVKISPPPVVVKPAPSPTVVAKISPPPVVVKPEPSPPLVVTFAQPPVLTRLAPPPVAVKPSPIAVKPAPAPATPLASPPMLTSVLRVPVRAPMPAPAMTGPAPREPVQVGKGVPDLETTQTVRALTAVELENDESSRWFVIQLSLAEQAFDPEEVPNLDIFSVYRLYSVAGIDQGRIFHALRLGFFSEEIAARAVASYLTTFYERPTIKRVSTAERDRFAQQPLEPRKDVGATGKQAVIEITNERYIRERRIGQNAGK